MRGDGPGAILERSGWARSVGGSNPYLTLFARGGISKEQADQAVRNLEIHELPCARGCTYVVPASEFALALRVGQPEGDGQEIKLAKKHFELTDAEIDHLCERVLDTLGDTPMEPAVIKDSVGDAVRNFGEAGKKRGMTTTLPMALGRLQLLGDIRRVSTNGRLDNQRYGYVRWSPGPLANLQMTLQEANQELARRFFRWIGPTQASTFSWFSGLGVKATQETLAPLGLVPVEPGSDFLMFPDELDAFHAHSLPESPAYALVSGADALFLHRREAQTFIDPEDRARKMQGQDKLYDLGGVAELVNYAILDRGRLIGLWEYDPAAEAIVWTSFVPVDDALRAAVGEMERFIREQLGDARSFSLDSPASRAPKLAALRAAMPM
jgi:hypothetical protein